MTPKLLRIPTKFQSVEDVCGAASRMDLPNALLISELEDGSITFLSTDMNLAQVNWLLDRLKTILLIPESFNRVS
jgi:hypothetical protein